jgi:SAM-dependent methyltransferase
MRFNQIEYAEYYHKQQVEAGYPGKLLPFVMRELEGFLTVLDIGAGTGLFSKPLTEKGYSVTAVEPSAEMINIMQKNLTAENLSSIKICLTPWEDWTGGIHDAAICVHSLYPMSDIKKAVTLMNESARRKIIIIRDTSGMRTLSGIVREKLGLASNRDLNYELSVLLRELSIEWRVENIYEERRHIIKNIHDEADSIIYQLKLDVKFKNDVNDIIKSEIKSDINEEFFCAIYSDNAYIF